MRLIWPWQDRNREFSWLKASAFALVVLPAIRFIYQFAIGDYGMLPIALGNMTYWSGVWATVILLLTLAVTPALTMPGALEARLEVLRRELLHASRSLTGAKVLAGRLYGVGPVAALAMTCWLGGAGRFSSSRKAVRFAGLDVTVWSSDRKGPPGRLSRQGPPALRWAVFEAAKTHARGSAPGHACYAAVKERKDGKRAAISEARKILRQACRILTGLGDDALTAA